MNTLIIARHAQHQSDLLTDTGMEQIRSLGRKLQERLAGKKILILTSTALRARRSANVLKKEFFPEVEVEPHEVLWSENSHPHDYKGLTALIDTKVNDADVLLLVTHYEYVDGYATYYGRNRLQAELKSKLIENGRAWLIDTEAKTIELI